MGNGEFVLGVIARKAGPILLVYFWGDRWPRVPQLEEIGLLLPERAAKVLRVGDLGLRLGEWAVVGSVPSFDSSQWPIPDFVRRDPLRPRAWKISYAQDLSSVIHMESVGLDSMLEGDGLCGHKAAEYVVRQAVIK
jgi:hypothetical protein